jgi:hypothetical protein
MLTFVNQAATVRQALLGNKTVLPPTWRLMTSDNGKPFYYNTQTKVTQWDPPVVLAAVLAPQTLGPVELVEDDDPEDGT